MPIVNCIPYKYYGVLYYMLLTHLICLVCLKDWKDAHLGLQNSKVDDIMQIKILYD